jgi:hypothetical protein
LGPARRWIWAFQVHNFCAGHNWAIPSEGILGPGGLIGAAWGIEKVR